MKTVIFMIIFSSLNMTGTARAEDQFSIPWAAGACATGAAYVAVSSTRPSPMAMAAVCATAGLGAGLMMGMDAKAAEVDSKETPAQEDLNLVQENQE